MSVVLPGATIGVLGSGQLGRMFTIAARRMGYRVATFSPEQDTPTGQVADEEVVASYDDLDAIRAFAKRVDVLTFEFENVPSAATEAAAAFVPVRPAGSVLHITQNRLREKDFLARHGFPVTPFHPISSRNELVAALHGCGGRGILKTAGFGYDGKGQARLDSEFEIEDVWPAYEDVPAVLEAFVPFERELSVVAARGLSGQIVTYGVVENRHRNHILDLTIAPASVPDAVAREAMRITEGILEALDVVGVLCVELFLHEDGTVLVNELAPRTHNSGHFTFDASLTSQFEQQLRAVCGLPLGSTEQLRPAAMVNLLGDLWESGEPNWQAAAHFPDVKIHLYGKSEARPGRKMGHLTALAATPELAARRAWQAREALTRR
ncbi:MAG: 5-(carboxyamino)imidazole ribonucleotide synthase [Bryobacterales bacterium]|nr:5-(carboxyamino)imidazole ribonucleotide synthase [Bryobacterales bacterium]